MRLSKRVPETSVEVGFVEGRLQTRSWEDKNGDKRYKTEVVCDSFGLMLLGDRGGASADSSEGYRSSGTGRGFSGGGRPSQPTSSPSTESEGSGGQPPPEDDDIPF